MMADGQEFCLRWNDFHSSFHVSLEALRGDESFTDVTLSCSGHLFKAHRVILSACSSHFKEILKEVPPQQHPVIVLPTVERDVMRAILEFIYQGQVNVRQARLGAFLQVAETFAIQGLADAETKKNAGRTPERPRAPDTVPAPTAKRRRLDQQQQQQQSQQPPSPTVSGAGPPVQPPPPPPPTPPLRGAEKTVNLDLTVKPEPDSMLDELEEMLEPPSDQPLQDVSPLDGSQDAHGLLSVSGEDMGGSQASRDGLAAAMVAAVVGQSPGGGGSGGRASLPQRSLVREYFTGTGQDRLCRLCGHVLRLNRQLSTSGMWRHMRVKHPELVQPAEPVVGACRPEPSLLAGAGSVWSELAASSADGSSGGTLQRIDGSTGIGSGVHEADWFFKS